jgi:hypothetical protein
MKTAIKPTESSGMSPFEIRLEVLKIAKELSTEFYYQRQHEIMENWQNSKVDDRATVDVKFPDFPTTDDILNKAKELYQFIQDKS